MSVNVFGNNCLKKHHKWKQWQLFRAVKRTPRTFAIPRISCRTQDTQDNIVKQQEISVDILQSSLVSFFRRWVDNLLVCLWKPAEMYREDHQKYHTIIKLEYCIKVYPSSFPWRFRDTFFLGNHTKQLSAPEDLLKTVCCNKETTNQGETEWKCTTKPFSSASNTIMPRFHR